MNSKMDYIAMGSLIVNHLQYADGSTKDNIMGGGAFYAYCGLVQYTQSASLLANTGLDYETWYGQWMEKNGISRQGINIVGEHASNTKLIYEPDGQWAESSIYGHDTGMYTFGLHSVKPETLDLFVSKPGMTKGVYHSYGMDSVFFEKIRDVADRKQFKIMWEVPTSGCKAENYNKFLDLVKTVEIYSINKPESFSLFSVSTVAEVIDKMLEIGIPCYYRVGRKGAFMVMDGQAAYVPMLSIVDAQLELDPTGCGNSSTATAMYAFFEGYDAPMIGIMSGITAGYTVQQYGPYPDYSPLTNQQALAIAQKLRDEYQNKTPQEVFPQ